MHADFLLEPIDKLQYVCYNIENLRYEASEWNYQTSRLL